MAQTLLDSNAELSERRSWNYDRHAIVSHRLQHGNSCLLLLCCPSNRPAVTDTNESGTSVIRRKSPFWLLPRSKKNRLWPALNTWPPAFVSPMLGALGPGPTSCCEPPTSICTRFWLFSYLINFIPLPM